MSIYRGVSNANREIQEQWRCVDGVNRSIKEQWCGAGGVNRQVYGNSQPPIPPQDYTCQFYNSGGSTISEFRNNRDKIYLSSYHSIEGVRDASVVFKFDGYNGIKIDRPEISINISNLSVVTTGGTGTVPYIKVRVLEFKIGMSRTYSQDFYFSFEKDITNKQYLISLNEEKLILIYNEPIIYSLEVAVVTQKVGAILAEIANLDITIGTTQLDFYSATII